ncbi:MAG: hypothetical protein KBS85_00990 [Lachnospiraceae bacterium]|nr:hypothetical protein [Candidatus Merdinaster equi]
MKLKTKITIVACLLLIVSMAAATIITLLDVSNSTTELVDGRATNNVKYFSAVIDGWMIENKGLIEGVADYSKTVSYKTDSDNIYAYLGDIVDGSDVISDCYIGIDTGFLFDGSGWVPDKDWSCLTRSWYINALATDEICYNDPYIDDNTGALCISLSKKTTFKDNAEGVIGMDLNITKLMEGVTSLVASNLSGDAYVVVGAGNDSVLFHPNSDFISTVNSTQYVSTINNGNYVKYANTGDFFKDYDGKEKFVVSFKLADNGWTVYLVEPKDVVTNTISSVAVICIISTVICLVIVVIVMIILLSVLLKPLNVGISALTTLSELDMKKNEEVSKYMTKKDEIGDIARAIDNLQTSLNSVVIDVNETANSLGNAVNSVDKLSATSANGADQIAQAVNELATTSQSMAETVQDANTSIIEMGNAIDNISSRISEMQASSTKSMEANDATISYMRKLKDASENSNKAVIEISEKIADCNESAESIKVAADVITSIASQTNLLSLNASIEAARAGEAGRGFAVVAGEISNLATQSDTSAKEIQEIISNIVNKVNLCVEQATKLQEIIDDQNKLLKETEEKIQLMSESGTEMATSTGIIHEESDNLEKIKEGILANVTDLSAISEENAASSEEVTASVESIAEAIRGTKEESEMMKSMADVLGNKMMQFKF